MKNFSRILKHLFLKVLLLLSVIFLTQCEYELPEEGSIADTTPPTSGFSFRQDSDEQLKVFFTNEARSATAFEWDFGDGNTSTERNPTNVYERFGTYRVSLTASDLLGVSDVIIQEIEVKEGPFQPIILESSFEDLALSDENGNAFGDGRDSWRNSDLGGVIQITTSPVQDGSGEQAAKLPGPERDERIGYQLVKVDTAQDYRLNFIYTLRDNLPGFVSVYILSGPVSTREEAEAAAIRKFTGRDQRDPREYTSVSLTFNSGDSDEIAIFFFNDRSVEARLDDFSISPTVATVIPPDASFSFEQDEEDPLKYKFINNSIDSENFVWDFGDGSEGSEEENPTHKFPSFDTYTVTLVAEKQFLTDTTSVDVIIPDPVEASFEYVQDPDNFLQVAFTNTSEDWESLLWDFDDGFFSTKENPVHTYAKKDNYTVTLTATGVSGATSVTSVEVIVAEGFVPVIQNPSFDDEPERDNNTEAWRNRNLENSADALFGNGTWTTQTTTTERTGLYAAKLPTFQSENSGEDIDLNRRRWLYQAIEVQPNTEYTISCYIRNKDANAGTTVTFDIYNAPFDDAVFIDNPGDRIIATEVFNASTGHDTNSYTLASITFNSGASSEVVLFITNDFTLNGTEEEESETFLDDFSIE